MLIKVAIVFVLGILIDAIRQKTVGSIFWKTIDEKWDLVWKKLSV